MKVRALLLVAGSAWLAAGEAHAQYRVRADAYFSGSDTTTGLVMLTSEARLPSSLNAETVVWLGTGDAPAHVLVADVRARDPKGRGEVRVGRMLVTAGGLRPVHMDGVDAVGRLPWGTSFQAFGGLPVITDDGARDFDWVVGQRLAQRFGQFGVVGVSYLQMRSTGDLAFEELGLDAAATPTKWLDAAFAGAYDLVQAGLADARISLASRFSKLRFEVFAARRSPSHLLPATSLFSALGDVPSDRAGASLTWHAAPRLDIYGEGAGESLAGQPGGRFLSRATLRLDDHGDGAMGLELRREGAPDASWTGLRATARVPLSHAFLAATELEIVLPDDPRGRGSAWPWGLVSLRYSPHPSWDVAGAFEASSSPSYVAALRGVLRFSYRWATR